MVSDFFANGSCIVAQQRYSEMHKECSDYLAANPGLKKNEIEKLKRYQVHNDRQQAEMLRLSGQYGTAKKRFQDIFGEYDYWRAEERIFCQLGQAECSRMLGEQEEAERLYSDVETYAEEYDRVQLTIRVMRNKACLYQRKEASYEKSQQCLSKLQTLISEAPSPFGRLYYLLTDGALHLKSDLGRAQEMFGAAKSEAQVGEQVLKLEQTHALLGLTEVARMRKIAEAKEAYKTIYYEYDRMGILWGKVRAGLGFALCAGEDPNILAFINQQTSTDPTDLQLLGCYRNQTLEWNTVLFVNAP